MARASTTPTTRTDPSALPSRIGRLLGEVRWFLLLAVTIAFLIILLSYNRADPGFTHASQVDEIRNLGGRVGAWLADLLLFVFGASAYWWAVLLVRKVWRGWRELMSDERLPRTSMPRVDASVTWIGFALILASSMGLEAIRMYSLHMKLPRAPGGVLGDVIGGAMQHSLGFTGGTLALLFTFLVGLSLFFHFSWLNLAEQIGAGVEMLFVGFKTRRESNRTAPSARRPRSSARKWSKPAACALKNRRRCRSCARPPWSRASAWSARSSSRCLSTCTIPTCPRSRCSIRFRRLWKP